MHMQLRNNRCTSNSEIANAQTTNFTKLLHLTREH